MCTVDALLPDWLLADAGTLARVAQTFFGVKRAEAADITGMHLACSTLSMRVLTAFLGAIPPESSVINIKTKCGQTLLQFMLERHRSWTESMGPILGALMRHGYTLDSRDNDLIRSSHKALVQAFQNSADFQTAQNFLDLINELHSSDAAELLFALCDQLLRLNVDIFKRESQNQPSIVAKMLYISAEKFGELADWLHTHFPNEFTLKLLLAHKLGESSVNTTAAEISALLDDLKGRDGRLLDGGIWLDTFSTRKHVFHYNVKHSTEPIDKQANVFSLWHLLSDRDHKPRLSWIRGVQPEMASSVVRWLHSQHFDFNTVRDASAASAAPSKSGSLFTGLHFAFLALKGPAHFPLLEEILTACYSSNTETDPRDLHLAILAENPHAVEWLLGRDGPRLCSQRIQIPTIEFDIYQQYFHFPFNSQSHFSFEQMSPLGLICLQQNADLLRFLMESANDETRQQLIAQSSNVLNAPVKVISFLCGKIAGCVSKPVDVALHPFVGYKCDALDAVLYKDLHALDNAAEEPKFSRPNQTDVGEILEILCEWHLFSIMDSDAPAQLQSINPSLQNLMLSCDPTNWADHLLPLFLETPFIRLHSDPNCPLTLFELLCCVLPTKQLTRTIKTLSSPTRMTCLRESPSNTRALIGGLTICIIRNRLECCKLLCALLEQLIAHHQQAGTPIDCVTEAVNIFRPTCYYVSAPSPRQHSWHARPPPPRGFERGGVNLIQKG